MASDILSVGDIGDNVLQLQAMLQKQGFTISPSEVNRKFFGPSTRSAVSDYQQKNSLSVTGEMGLNATLHVADTGITKKILPGADTPVNTVPSSSPTVRTSLQTIAIFGDKTPLVAALQTWLTKLGLGPIGADELNTSLFGQTTCKALQAFKDKNNIKTYPCLVENATADKMNALLADRGSKLSITYPLIYGMNSQAIADLQNGFSVLGYKGTAPAESGTFGDSTCKMVLAFQKEMQIKVTACYLDQQTANQIASMLKSIPVQPATNYEPGALPAASGKSYRVSGTVINRLNDPVPGQHVNAFDVDLKGAAYYATVTNLKQVQQQGGMQYLGEATSDDNGYYEVNFPDSFFIDAEEALADVIVYAYTDDGTITGHSKLSVKQDYTDETELKNWNVQLDAADQRGNTEYARLIKIVNPFMDKSGLSLYQLAGSTDQILFLSTELDQDLMKVNILVSAASLFKDVQVAYNNSAQGIETWQELLYGLGKQAVKLDWPTISKTSISAIIIYVQRSFDSNIITVTGTNSNEVTATITRFAQALHNFSVQKNLNNSATQPNGIKNLLSIAIKNNDTVTQKFYQSYINRTGTPEEFWTGLRADPDFTDKVDTLLMTNRLSALTNNNVNLIQRLIVHAPGNDVTKLLEISTEDWNAAIGNDLPADVPGKSIEEKVTNYRLYMQGMLYAAFPNAQVALMIKNGLTGTDPAISDLLYKFMDSTKFDLRINRLYDKADTTTNATFQDKLDASSGDKKQAVTDELNKIQRVFQFSPSPDIMIKLLNKGVDSATMIASLPYSTFKIKYQDIGDELTLLSIYQRAAHIVSMIEYSILSLNRFSQSAKVPAITGQNNT